MTKKDELSRLFSESGFDKWRPKFEAALRQAVVSGDEGLTGLALSMVDTGGKRLRPFMTLCAAKAISRSTRLAVKAAVSVELIHLGSLVHDDIIDNSAVRRGVPTIYRQSGQNKAILAGDYLLALGAGEAAKISGRAGQIAAKAIAKMCGGQDLELDSSFDLSRSASSYAEAIRGKTGSLFAAACALGGICAGADPTQANKLYRYGQNFGVAFQMIDDLLDILSDENKLGKPAGIDIANGIYTLPVILSLRGPNAEQVSRIIQQSSRTLKDRRRLASLLLDDGSVDQTVSQIMFYNTAAIRELASFAPAGRLLLARLPQAILDSALTRQLARDSHRG